MGMATLEANMEQQVGWLDHKLIFQVFLDRWRHLEILMGYRLGPKLFHLLNYY